MTRHISSDEIFDAIRQLEGDRMILKAIIGANGGRMEVENLHVGQWGARSNVSIQELGPTREGSTYALVYPTASYAPTQGELYLCGLRHKLKGLLTYISGDPRYAAIPQEARDSFDEIKGELHGMVHALDTELNHWDNR